MYLRSSRLITTEWTVTPSYQQGDTGDAFSSLEKVFSLPGELITTDPISAVYKVRVGDKYYFVKRYTAGGKGIRRYLGPSRVKMEWQNLLFFQKLGLPTAPIVAYGESRFLGKTLCGALITEELVGTDDLASLAQAEASCLKDHNWVTAVSNQVADATRVLHRERFAHNDLKWRNVLVTTGPNPQIYLIDCPAGTRWFGPMLSYRKIKDLACLDKVAKYQLTPKQRLAFYKRYRQCGKLSIADKHQIRKILQFFAGRE